MVNAKVGIKETHNFKSKTNIMTEQELRQICNEEIIKQRLTKMHLSQLAGLSIVTISLWTRGKKDLKYSTIIRIVNALGLTLSVK